MNTLSTIVIIITAVGSAMIGGVFFAFSSFIMRAFARLPSSEGMAAMQSVNVTVLNPLFLGVFLGTTVLSLLVVFLVITDWQQPATPYFLAGGLSYFMGTFLVTGMGNVPLNEQLAKLDPGEPASEPFWQHYLERWTRFNSLRMTFATAATTFLFVGLLH